MFGDSQQETQQDSPQESQPASKGLSVGYYQGKPVLVDGNAVYSLPAPIFVTEGEVTESPEEYDPGAEAEAKVDNPDASTVSTEEPPEAPPEGEG